MKKHLIAATAAASIALAGLTAPASAEVPITINAGVGYWFFDHEVQGMQPDDTGTPFVGLEYAIDDNWAAEILFADDSTDFEGGGPNADVTTWQLGMLYYGGSYIGEAGRVRPYLAFGAGEIDIDAGTFDTVETTVNAGAGIRWMLSERVGVRLETRAIHSVDESDTDLLVSAGLNFWLGKIAPDAPPAPLDTDGDGVTDDKDLCPGTPAGTRVDATGCPLAVAQVASIKLMVNFGFDSTKVEERYFADLSELAEFLKRFSDVQVDVEGHTDSAGAADYNQSLSQRRSQAVVDLLVNQYGIEASRLEAKGYGESQPVASNDTDEGRAENRRVMATLEVEYAE
ncbi:MAG: OOP family OmpA-OmpF porin [Halioglobus sp.]|jgi:OOP family OmpA-OmpF porin